MKQLLIPFFTTYIALILLDVVWLSATGPLIYKLLLGELLTPEFTLWPTSVFYPLYALSLAFCAFLLQVFVVIPNIQNNAYLRNVVTSGTFFGLFAHRGYSEINQPILENWFLISTVINLTWGMTVSALASITSIMTLRKFFKIEN